MVLERSELSVAVRLAGGDVLKTATDL